LPSSRVPSNWAAILHVRDRKIVKVESADYPDDPEEMCICFGNLFSLRLIYNPDRLKYWLKRISKRGEGKCERISWEGTLKTISDNLLEVKEKYGRESVKIAFDGSISLRILVMGRLM
jgi:anaerobic selenocysteine-containing dehydrogenase